MIRGADSWERLYRRVRDTLLQFGSEGSDRAKDCWVDDDDVGTKQQKVYIRNLALLRPHVINALRNILKPEFSDWEIMIAVSVPGTGESWPDMGLTIRSDEIIDGLQRNYFPQEFRNIAYDNSKAGTEAD